MRIKNIKKIEKRETYDLNIRGNHNYFVSRSEILVHNSGKDGTKVDRSAAYMARYIAIDLLKNESPNLNDALVHIAYAIGVDKPIQASALLRTNGNMKYAINNLADRYDLRPKSIIEFLELKNPIYYKTAEWGPFGNFKENFSWENK